MKIKEFVNWLKVNIKGEVEISKIDIVGNKIKLTYMLPYNSFEFDFEEEFSNEDDFIEKLDSDINHELEKMSGHCSDQQNSVWRNWHYKKEVRDERK